eukprot:UN04939
MRDKNMIMYGHKANNVTSTSNQRNLHVKERINLILFCEYVRTFGFWIKFIILKVKKCQ